MDKECQTDKMLLTASIQVFNDDDAASRIGKETYSKSARNMRQIFSVTFCTHIHR